jgi:hypothetical protein
MKSKRFSLEEFRTLFADKFESPEQLLREYQSLQAVFEHLDATPVPELSTAQKAEIFRRTWQDRRRLRIGLGVFRRPLVAFAAGIILGCTLMFAALNTRASASQPAPVGQSARRDRPVADRMLTVEHTGRTQVYTGKIVKCLYPQIENPKIVLEKTEGHSTPQRVLYGTLDDGAVTIVWNL